MNSEEVLRKYEDIIIRLSYIYKVEGYAPEDLQQEFRMLVLTCLAKFDKSKNVTFNTYLTRSCENRVKRLRRKQEWTVSLNADAGQTIEFLDLLETKELDPENFGEKNEMVTFIIDILAEMKYGHITKMYLMYGIPQTEIAELEGISQSYVNKLHNKNLAEVRKQLSRKYLK